MARGGKKKQEKVLKLKSVDGWQHCSKCCILINCNDLDHHFEECKNNESSLEELEISFLDNVSTVSVSETLPQSFIKDDIFYGEVGALNVKYSSVLNSTFMKEWENIVFLNPITMRNCNISHEDYVIVKRKNYCFLYIAYPLRFIRSSAIVFPKNGSKFKLKEKAIVQSYRKPIKEAVQILVSCKTDIRMNAELNRYLLGKLYKTFVVAGMKLKIKYFDYIYEFTIQKILNSNNQFSECYSEPFDNGKNLTDSRIGDICDLSDLNLSESFDLNESKLSVKNSSNQSSSIFSSTPQSTCKRPQYNLTEKNDFLKNLEDISICEQMPTYFRVTSKTVLSIDQISEAVSKNIYKFNEIGGLNEQLHFIKSYLEVFLHSEKNSHCGIVMLTGPSGTGKSLVLNVISSEYNVHIETICWYEILCSSNTEVGIKKITSIFQTAVKSEPSIIIIDEFDCLCPGKTGSFKGNIHHLICKKLCSLIQELPVNMKVLIIAAANSDFNDFISHINGKLYNEVKFPIPSPAERKDIFEKILHKRKHTLTTEQIKDISESAHGFTGKNFLSVLKDAESWSFQEQLNQGLVNKDFENCPLEYNDILRHLKQKKCDIVEDVKAEQVQWCDIGGMQDVKAKLRQVIEWPLKCPEVLKIYGITPSRGVLMYGPPGCSKTMIAKALANECGLNFIAKKSADLFNKWVGESEKAVRDLFSQARAAAPCVIFFDEIDALVTERGSDSSGSGVGDRIVTSLLTEIDGIEELHGIVIIAATNRPDMLDDALTRNGRINHFIYVPLPDERTREEIFRIQMKSRSVSEDIDIKQLVLKTEGFTGAEVVNICNEAAMNLLIEDPTVKSAVFQMRHFEKALNAVLPRTTKEMLEFYEKYNSIFLSNK